MSRQSLLKYRKFKRYFNIDSFWNKVQYIARKVGQTVLLNVLTLYYASVSDETPLQDKLLIVGVLGYLILPFDFVPDFIPYLGLTDDASAIALCLTVMKRNITQNVKLQAQAKLEEILSK